MNRDTYSVILCKARRVLTINMLNVTGRWERALVHEDVVKGYVCCKCLLMCLHNANPAKPNASKLIDNWEKLLDIHHEENRYRLLPLHTFTTNGFAALLQLVGEPGSPFALDDRVSYLPYCCAVGYKSPVRTAIERFFNVTGADRLPIDRIEFDAVLRNKDHAALIVLKASVNQSQIQHFANTMKFVTSKNFLESSWVDPVPWKFLLSAPNRHLILFSESTVPMAQERPLADLAKKEGITLYHRKGNDYCYLPPTPESLIAPNGTPLPA